MRIHLVVGSVMLLSLSAVTGSVCAETPPDSETTDTAVDEATERGRQAVLRGLKLAKSEQWGDALAAFEQAAAARDAPLVQYNIAYCQRALGRYVAARRTAKQILAAPGGLSTGYVEDLKGYVSEFDAVVVRVEITMVPKTAALTIDGHPLEKSGEVYVTGKSGGAAATIATQPFSVLLDPGSHVFLARREGHQDVVVQRSFRPGQRDTLDLRLDEMPATVVIKSQPTDAIIRVDEHEVGVAPATFERPPGKYRVEVYKDEYETYSTQLDLAAGQRAELTAELLPYETPVYERWWFWTSLVGAVATGVVTAVVATLPEPVPPDYQTGSSGWLVDPQPAGVPAFRF